MRTASLLFLVAVCAGCHGAAWDKTEVPPPATPSRGGETLTQYCTYNGATDLAEVNDWLQRLGRQGWELVAVGGQTATVYCFRARAEGLPSASEPPR